jgi:hypothetical protein
MKLILPTDTGRDAVAAGIIKNAAYQADSHLQNKIQTLQPLPGLSILSAP